MPYVNPLVLTVEQIREISNYAHWIPITRGYHRELLETKYPGWDWNDFLPILDDAGLIRRHEEGHQCQRLMMGLCINAGVETVTFTKKNGRTRAHA
jgi:hypothetical protein